MNYSTMSNTRHGERPPLSKERQQVLSAHEAGLSPRQIAAALDVSTQRIYQQLDKLRADGFIKEAS